MRCVVKDKTTQIIALLDKSILSYSMQHTIELFPTLWTYWFRYQILFFFKTNLFSHVYCDFSALDPSWLFVIVTLKHAYSTDDVEKAEGRSTSVYVGLDVWGRYTKEYEAFMDIPRGLKLVEDASLSVCLFAPAYSYEKFRLSAWELKDKAFWDGVSVTLDSPSGYSTP